MKRITFQREPADPPELWAWADRRRGEGWARELLADLRERYPRARVCVDGRFIKMGTHGIDIVEASASGA